MKFSHKANLLLSLAAAVVAAFINLALYGNFLAAFLGAGTLTFLMGLVLHYGIDVVWHYWDSRKKA